MISSALRFLLRSIKTNITTNPSDITNHIMLSSKRKFENIMDSYRAVQSILIFSFLKGDVVASLRYVVEVRFRRNYIRVEGSSIYVGLLSRPEKGKANLELIKKLARYFKIHSSQIKIVSGLKSKSKIIEITDA